MSAKWLITDIVFTLSFLLLNLVITTSDLKDIYMNCPDVTLRCIKSHLYNVVFISTCNVLKSFHVRFYHCTAYTVSRVVFSEMHSVVTVHYTAVICVSRVSTSIASTVCHYTGLDRSAFRPVTSRPHLSGTRCRAKLDAGQSPTLARLLRH